MRPVKLTEVQYFKENRSRGEQGFQGSNQRINDVMFCFVLIVVDTGCAGIHHSKYWMPIHYDKIEDGQNKTSHHLFSNNQPHKFDLDMYVPQISIRRLRTKLSPLSINVQQSPCCFCTMWTIQGVNPRFPWIVGKGTNKRFRHGNGSFMLTHITSKHATLIHSFS